MAQNIQNSNDHVKIPHEVIYKKLVNRFNDIGTNMGAWVNVIFSKYGKIVSALIRNSVTDY